MCATEIVAPSIYSARARLALPADLVVILLGTNDAAAIFEPESLSPARYRDAIRDLTLQLQLDGAARVMLMTPPQFYGGPVVRLRHYRDEILELCSPPADSILCGPDVHTLLQLEDFAPEDPHPNAAGHAKIAEALRDAIVTALPAR
jgi:lysophospholipase L1-like esterase